MLSPDKVHHTTAFQPLLQNNNSVSTSLKPSTTMSIAHYTVPIPDSATICSDWPTLCEEARSNYGHCMLNPKYGGYVFEEEGVIRLVCTDNFCAIIDEKGKEASTITFHHPASGVKIGNYTVGLSDSARVVTEWTSLRPAAMERPNAPIVKRYGGWVIEDGGAIVIACDEEMSTQCDECPEQLKFIAEDVAELLRTQEERQNANGC